MVHEQFNCRRMGNRHVLLSSTPGREVPVFAHMMACYAVALSCYGSVIFVTVQEQLDLPRYGLAVPA